jgi:hypothetical protein
MKILVTGGKGFIGSKIVEMLTIAGHKVTVVDNHDTYGIMTKEELDKLYKKIGTRDIKEVYSKSNPERLLSSYPTTVLKGDGYGEVSDIIDALAYGKFQRTYNTWGHGQSYYKRRGSIEKEIFANLFSLRNDKKAYALTKSIIPNTVKEFEKRLDELEKQ